jgi:DNA mismatch repair protein MutS
MGILDDYLSYYNKYHKKYGESVIVFYQNGMFFEIYGVENETEKLGNAREMAEMLNITLARKNNSILEINRTNHYIVGFPIAQLEKYANKMSEQFQYIVVVIEQITQDPIRRGVTNIITPSTNIRYLSKQDANYLVSIYIDKTTNKLGKTITNIGLSSIDVSTGINNVYQTWNTNEDNKKAIDEALRFIRVYQPKEVIINELTDQLELDDRLVHIKTSNLNSVKQQNNFLSKIYPKHGMFQPIEYIGLEKYPIIVSSFINLLEFCYDKNETILSSIKIPKLWDTKDNVSLILDNNAATQLNIINTSSSSTGKLSSVFNLINNTSTPMGRRYLLDRLMLPMISPDKMIENYNIIDEYRTVIPTVNSGIKPLSNHLSVYKFQKYEIYLNNINDIERIQRKLCLQMLHPYEFNSLLISYENIKCILSIDNSFGNELSLVNNFLNYIKEYLDFDQTTKFNMNNIKQSVFNYGIYQELDEYEDKIESCEDFVNEFINYINNLLGNANGCYNEYRDDIGYFIDITITRYNSLMAIFKKNNIEEININNIIIKVSEINCEKYKNGKNCKLTFTLLNKYSDIVREARYNLINKTTQLYKQFQYDLYNKFELTFNKITNIIAEIDYYKSCAKTSLLYNYCRPIINSDISDISELSDISDNSDISELKAIKLRHPLIEQFQNSNLYIPQDIDMTDKGNRGILLFGVNCSGKSSLMKAIGIAVIMAQCGMFVPATEFTFYPFKSIMTRIIGNDNLFKGLSSFAVEMSELRGIIQRANKNTLVLGDEICHGTETISALAIVAASIITLLNKNVVFLFATHLHHLSKMQEINKESSKLGMFHLKVIYDEKTDTLIYDRNLEKGSGSNLYGLEVAKAMHFDNSFMELANNIRKDLTDFQPLLSNKKSQYNADLILDNCKIPECKRQANDTHHIKFQCNANDKGFNDHVQKNHKSNLIPLCKPCHQMVHSGLLIINGYKSTANGPLLDYKFKSN